MQVADQQLGKVVIPLLQGVIYQERQPLVWQQLLNQQTLVREYTLVLGLNLVIDEAEGYAYLCQQNDDEQQAEVTEGLPRLIPRRPLSYIMSVLCLLLRKKLLEHDTSESGDNIAVLSRKQMIMQLRVYLPERHNEAKLTQQIDSTINKAVEIGFLRPLKELAHHYEVRRIVKAFVNAQWLQTLNEKLEEYQQHAKRIV